MDIVKGPPPNIKDIEEAFPFIKDKRGVIYTYGLAIFNPDGGHLDEPLLLHEATHSLQQDKVGGPAKWWKKYLADPEFRLDQELEAYQNQYRRYCELVTDKNRRAVFLFRIANDLSSPQYGGIIEAKDARQRIANFLS